jgi:hypothetical protein
MDPILEITLCGDVILFVQLSIKLLTSSGELYRKAELEAQNIIAASVRQVQDLAIGAIELCRQYEVKLQRGLGSESTRGSELQRICQECHDVAQTINENLNKLLSPQNIPRRGWRSLQVALIGVWSKKEIDEQVQRLKDARASMETSVLSNLR